MKVQEIMTHDVVACRSSDTMDRAVQLMLGKDCGCVPVVDEHKRVVGMITDRDICLAAHNSGKALSQLAVADGMAGRVECCAPAESVGEAERKLRERQLRRLPVVDLDGHLLGILAMAELARAAARTKKAVTPAEVCGTLAEICRPRREETARA